MAKAPSAIMTIQEKKAAAAAAKMEAKAQKAFFGELEAAHKAAEKVLNLVPSSSRFNAYLGDPWARVVYPMDLRPVLDEIGSRFSVAIGCAMRDIGD